MGLRYQYVVEGLAAEGQTWKHTGILNANTPGDFVSLPQDAIRESFVALTNGLAEFGSPGKGCRGPYEITKLLIEAP